MFKNVLVGVDGRLGGRDAIALAGRLLEPQGALTLSHVYDGFLGPVRVGDGEERRAAAEQLLETERAEAGVDAELLATDSRSTGRGLHELAEQRGADLLVLGTCRRGTIGRVVLGSDTRAALNGAPCAVAVAPAGFAEQARPFATIGVAYDGSPESVAALTAARELAEPTNALVRALQVVSYPTYVFTGLVPPVGEGITEMVKEADARMRALPDVEGRAEYGLAGEDLAAFSKELDLLVVGSRGYGPARRMLAGSTANYLLSHARSPLLILPRGTEHATPPEALAAGNRAAA